MFSRTTAPESTPKPAKRCPQATASRGTRSGGSCFFFFLSPPITQEARGGNERDLHARGRSIWPEAARSCETPAAMMARPCCRGHFITQFSRRGAHSPPPVSSYSRTPQNAEVAPVCPTASNLQPTVTRAADGRELSAGMGCRCSPPPRHITS